MSAASDVFVVARSCADGAQECCCSPAKVARLQDFQSQLEREQTQDNMPRDKENPIDKYKEKVVNDCIHGHIVLPPAAVAIVDTEQFQRLRDLKQTGNCHLVYPNATHNRFQHSLGVAHLAFKWANALRLRYPKLADEKDALCVMLAGLCHDLGHGPYSHLWEHFIKEANPNADYHHEDGSVKMFDHLLESNNLKPVLKDLAGIDDDDITFIKELIAGPLGVNGLPIRKKDRCDDSWQYKGRPEQKSFLYEIVANKWSGVDVDKWDYLIRDDYFMKIRVTFDYERFIKYSRVETIEDTKRTRIVLRDKEASMLKDMYNDRARLHMSGYQHRVTLICDRMMLDAWLLADGKVTVNCKGRKLKMSEASVESIEAHERLTDEYVKHVIMESDSSDPEVLEAQDLYRRIAKRELYLDLLTLRVRDEEDSKKRLREEQEILSQIQELVRKGEDNGLKNEDFTIIRRRITNGEKTKSEKDKKLQLHFYPKDSNAKTTDMGSITMPDNPDNNLLYVCIKRCGVEKAAREVIQAWKDKHIQAWENKRFLNNGHFQNGNCH